MCTHSLLSCTSHVEVLGRLCTMPMSEFDMQTKELNNGRLAMIAVAAFTVQVGLTSQVFVSYLSHVKDKLSAYAGQ